MSNDLNEKMKEEEREDVESGRAMCRNEGERKWGENCGWKLEEAMCDKERRERK